MQMFAFMAFVVWHKKGSNYNPETHNTHIYISLEFNFIRLVLSFKTQYIYNVF